MWNILIADDDSKDRKALVGILESTAHCIEAKTGKEAVDIFVEAYDRGEKFDFILLDVTMPEQDGFAALKDIRAYEEKGNSAKVTASKVIMITTYKDSLMEEYNMGWDEFITKPVDAGILIKKMNSMLQTG